MCEEYWSLGIPPRLADPSTSSRLQAEPCDAPVAALRYARAYTNPVTFESLGDWNWRADLADLAVPTLVIHGEQEAAMEQFVRGQRPAGAVTLAE